MHETEVWSAIDRHRTAAAQLFSGLSDEQWATPSLCDAWRVRDVAAHLTMLDLPWRTLAPMFLRHPRDTNAMIRDGSRDLARRFTTDEITGHVRALAGSRRTFPGLGPGSVLIDLLAHTYDITIPLGMAPDQPRAELAHAADQVIAFGDGRSSAVFRRLPWRGRRLVATDHDWARGEGPVLEDTMAGLFLMLTGREARP